MHVKLVRPYTEIRGQVGDVYKVLAVIEYPHWGTGPLYIIETLHIDTSRIWRPIYSEDLKKITYYGEHHFKVGDHLPPYTTFIHAREVEEFSPADNEGALYKLKR